MAKKKRTWVFDPEEVPEIEDVDWGQLFSVDPGILGDVINDVIRVVHSSKEKNRRGKRSNVKRSVAKNNLEKIQNIDFSNEEFIVSVRYLKLDRSIRCFARKVGLNTSKVQRLLEGKVEPTAKELEQIAEAFDKHPSYFLEYRIAYVVSAMSSLMKTYPESSIVQYVKLSKETL